LLKRALIAAMISACAASPVLAQPIQYQAADGFNNTPVSAANPLPVNATTTVGGFAPNGNYGTLTATAATSASTAMPAGTVVAFQNLSSVDVSCVFSSGTATATTNKTIVRGGATVYVTVGSNVNAACINQTGSASNVVSMAGGAGLGTNFGGGGSGGGGGAVTVADGADVTQGAQADAAAAADTSTASLISLLKRNNQNLTTLNTTASSGIPTGANSIGTVGLNTGTNVVGVVGNSQGSTTSGQSGPLAQGAVTTAAPSYTTAQTSPLSLTTAGALRVDPSAVTAPTSVADGSNVTFGAKADAATCATTNTAMACFRQLHTDVTSSIPAGSAVIGVVGNSQGSTTSGQSGPLVQCAVTTANPAYTTAQTSPASCNINGALRVKQAPGTQESCASGNVAAATAACTLAASAGHTTYITGFQMTAGGSTAAALVTCTLTGTITGTKSYTFAFPAGVAVGATPLNVVFNPPLPASAANTTIVASCPSGGAGNTNATMTADGFQE
jgi:hypothetical protein